MGYSKQLVVPLCQDFLALDPADPRMGKVRGGVDGWVMCMRACMRHTQVAIDDR